ncbi:MAG: hypothetical protein GC152_07095 [Alphaproteobacteria bacterium]|nr:hypothetical protein [Alphaproteobacteria bacterium]
MTVSDVRARVAWLGAQTRPSSALVAALKSADYALHRPPRRPIGGPAEIALVDVRRAADPVGDAKDLLAKSGLLGAIVGVVILASGTAAEADRLALGAIGDVCLDPIGPKAVTARIRNRLRVAAIAEEAGDRLKSAVAAELSVRMPVLTEGDSSPRLLFAGAPSPLALKAMGAISDTEQTAVFNAGQALRASDAMSFDATIFVPSGRDDLLLALARTLRRNSEFAGAPMFALVEDPDVAAAFGLIGIEPVRRNQVDLAFAAKVRRAAERARLVASLRRFLADTRDAMLAAPDRTPTFFAAHATRLGERARKSGRPFSLIGIVLRNSAGRAADDAAAAALRQISCTCRAEDIPLLLGEGAVVIIAPATTYHDAMRIAARAAGVIAGRSRAHVSSASLKLDETSVLRPPAPDNCLTVDAVEWRPGDTPQSLIARLFGQLKEGADAASRRIGA